MVEQIANDELDPVAERLASAGEDQSPSVLQWLEAEQQRRSMRRRATLCAVSGWLLMTTAAIVSSFVALNISHDIREIFDEGIVPGRGIPVTVTYLPILLVVIAVLLIVGGIAGWFWGVIPGLSKTTSAIDWSATSDAVTRLLSIGCTYPEAFRTAAKVVRGKSRRTWLIRAADRVERGGPDVAFSPYANGDTAMLELMIDAAESEPQRQWKVAAEHFLELARERLMLLLQSTPMIATLISGLLIWVSISATLSWMWRGVAELMRGLS
jgi:hypothetical protein